MREVARNQLDGPAVERHCQARMENISLTGPLLALLPPSLGLSSYRSSSPKTSCHL